MRYTVWFFERDKGKLPGISKGNQDDNSSSISTVNETTEDMNQPQWIPFSRSDSNRIEKAYLNDELDEPILVDGTFFIINLDDRTMTDTYYGIQ